MIWIQVKPMEASFPGMNWKVYLQILVCSPGLYLFPLTLMLALGLYNADEIFLEHIVVH